METNDEIAKLYKELEQVKFLSPNEPLTRYGVQRLVAEMSSLT